jgi:hypothetical protein
VIKEHRFAIKGFIDMLPEFIYVSLLSINTAEIKKYTGIQDALGITGINPIRKVIFPD